MLRTAAIRIAIPKRVAPAVASTLAAARRRISVAAPLSVRYNSSTAGLTPEQRKALLKEKDELNKDWTAPSISYEEVKRRSQQPSTEAFLIDVREPDEVIQGSIPSSVNLPLSQIQSAMKVPAEDWQRKFGWPKPKPEQEIVFYCRSGKRSASAADVARQNGFKNILNYEGSWLDWVAKEGKK